MTFHLLGRPSQSTEFDPSAHVKDLPGAIQDPDQWYEEQGVLVYKGIPAVRSHGYDTNPVADKRVRGLGGVSLRHVRESFDENGDNRLHRMYTIARDLGGQSFRHAVEITDPAEGKAEFVIASFPGFTEPIEGSIRREMHPALANEFPSARVISVASNGIGINGDHFGWSERSSHGLRTMGLQRLALIRALAKNKPVYGSGTSMGTVIETWMAYENMHATKGQRIDLRGNFWLSPAVVDPENIPGDMALRFLPGMAVDAVKEVGLKSTPREAIHLIRALAKYGLSKDDVVPMACQLRELLRGIPERVTETVVQNIPTVMVAGENDVLAQWEMMERLQDRGAQLVTIPIHGRGHALGMKPHIAAKKIRRESDRHLPCQAPPRTRRPSALAA